MDYNLGNCLINVCTFIGNYAIIAFFFRSIAFDGDSIGQWVNGDFLPDKNALQQHHSNFSKALSKFALEEVRKIPG